MGNGLDRGRGAGSDGTSGRAAAQSPKAALRRSLLTARGDSRPADRAADDARLAERLVGWIASEGASRSRAGSAPESTTSGAADRSAAASPITSPIIIAAHVPVDVEPGSTSLEPDQLLTALSAIEGMPPVRLLLPVCPPGPPSALRWAAFELGEGSLAPGKYGLPEPTGPRLPPESIRDAAIVVVPGVAADRTGMRMGRGAGYYDRSLAHATGAVAVILHPNEVVDHVPADDHDVPVDAVITANELIIPGG